MTTILNERKYAEDIVLRGGAVTSPYSSVYLLAKYFAVTGEPKKEAVSSILSLLGRSDCEEPEGGWLPYVAKAADKIYRKAKRIRQNGQEYRLLDLDSIEVTEQELGAIRRLDKLPLERLAFVLLVHDRLRRHQYGHGYFGIRVDKFLFKAAELPAGQRSQLMINELKQLGYITTTEFYVHQSNLVSVLFIDEDSPVSIRLDNLNGVTLHYELWRGITVIPCKICGEKMKPRHNANKICEACARQSQKEAKLRWWNRNKKMLLDKIEGR